MIDLTDNIKLVEALAERLGPQGRAMSSTFASMALTQWKPSWPVEMLAKWLGHSQISTTYGIYAHWIAVEPPSAWESVVRNL